MGPISEIVGELAQRLNRAEAERDALRDELEILRAALLPPVITPPLWGLTPGERKFLRALRAAHPHPMTRDRGMAALYGGSDTAPGRRILDVYVCNIRRKLLKAGTGFTVESVQRQGWVLTDPAALDAALDAATEQKEHTDAAPQTA